MRVRGSGARFDRRVSCGLLVALAFVAAGCTSGGTQQGAELMPGGESSYTWVGQGERGDFAASTNFCRRNQQLQNFGGLGPGQQPSAGSSTYSMPDVNFVGSANGPAYAGQRSLESCMRSQGWAPNVPGMQPTPAQPPAPPAAPAKS